MARQVKEERTIYCSGLHWEGDGSKATSACRFGASIVTTMERYKCSHCAIGQVPENIYASANSNKYKKALENDSVVQEDDSENDAPDTSEDVESPIEEVITSPEKPTLPKAKVSKKKRRRF